jgi:hypothetical protein
VEAVVFWMFFRDVGALDLLALFPQMSMMLCFWKSVDIRESFGVPGCRPLVDWDALIETPLVCGLAHIFGRFFDISKLHFIVLAAHTGHKTSLLYLKIYP